MRKILLLPALILSTLHVHAGENGVLESVTGVPVVGGLFPHFGLGGNPNAVLPANHRMIAKTYLLYKNGSFVPVDSVTYQYSEGRGSIPNVEDMNNDNHVLFDMSITYGFNEVSGQYENSRQRIQAFSNKKVSELVYKKWHTVTSAWKNAERYLYTYDNSGKMHSSILQMWYGTLWTNDINSVLNYDHNNNIVQMNSNTYTIDFVYDQNNNLVMIEDKTWSQSTGWSNHERKKYAYTGDEVSEYILEKWVGGAWVNEEKWEYIYDTKDNLTMATRYQWDGVSWKNTTRETYTYDANDNMLENTVKKWDAGSGSFTNSSREVRTYNKNNLPVALSDYTWDGTSWVHAENDIQIRYYYEQYFPAGVDGLVAGNNELTFYPIPAADNLHVAFNLNSSQDFSVAVSDMTGRIVYRENVTDAISYNKAIPVNNLPSGNYLLMVYGSNGINMSGKLIVAH